MSLLSDLFCSRVRSEIFRLLFNEAHPEIYLRELVRRSGLTVGTVQQDIKTLKKWDLIISRKDGNRVFYSANKNHPLYKDLCQIVSKTVGIIPQLKQRLLPLKESGQIEVAFVYGSIAKSKEKSLSDVDVMIIGKLGLRGASSALFSLTDQVGREINPHTLTPHEFSKRVKEKNHFITQVLSEPVTFLVGDQNDLERLAK